MQKIDSTVIKETKYIALWVLILSALMQAVFLVIGRWDYSVLFGNLLGAIASVLNFFLMGITVQKALGREEKEARALMKTSQIYRNLMVLVIVVIGVVFFNIWATAIPVFFARIAITFRPIFDKK
ncbi:MAG: hypothetical protein IJD17_05540 [Clostridia bacterium]|nr:hypothetical protein [Clostridia bacterium]